MKMDKLKIPTIAILRLIKTTPGGVNRKELQFRSGLQNISDLEAILKNLQAKNAITISGKGRGTKFIRHTDFDKSLVE